MRDVGDLAQQLDAVEVDPSRLARDEQRGVGLLDRVDDVSRTDADVVVRERDVLFGHRGPELTFAAPGQILRNHEHVHGRVRRVDGVERPLPDLSLGHGGVEGARLGRTLADGASLLTEHDQFRIPLERFPNQVSQRDGRPGRLRLRVTKARQWPGGVRRLRPQPRRAGQTDAE